MRTYTHVAHQRLEQHPRMHAYARGNLSVSEYRDVLTALLMFWQQSEPQSHNLPDDYYSFLEQYRAALREDALAECREECRDKSPRFSFDEIAFFYLLLGSSHGACYMLQLPADESLPRQHLQLLADGGKPLWSKFLHENLMQVDPARQSRVMVSARRMFDCLYATIDADSDSL